MINIDISEVVINQMKKAHKACDWRIMDATKMEFGDEEFSVVLDKGTLDAMMSEEKDTINESVIKYFEEIKRVLKNGGRFVCISLLQEHIIKYLLDFFPPNNFLFRIVRCLDAETKTQQTNDDGTSMPVFAVVLTKFLKLPNKIYEISQDNEGIERMTEESIQNAVLSIQRSSIIRNGLIRKNSYEDEITFDLYRASEKIPRFSLFILDQKSNSKKLSDYAAFICPQGRETEWLFSTKQGRKKLMESAGHARLAIVIMHRNQNYTSIDDIKLELNETVKNFAPKSVRDMSKIPFLSLGSDVGSRNVIYKGTSQISGDFVVEDVLTNGDEVRRLIFMSNQNAIQSEALLKRVKKGIVADHNHLSCQHHVYLIAGMIMMENAKNLKNLVIGLGGGGLLTFIYHHLKELSMTAIEIDPEIVKVAKEYFGLIEDKNRLEVIVDDGLEFLKNSEKAKYHSITFDVDSKDPSLGMSCPPKEFLEKDILKAVEASLAPNGIFILNFVSRDESIRENVVKSVKEVFPNICSFKLEEDLNEIFYCLKIDVKDFPEKFSKASKKLNSMKRGLIDVNLLLEKLKINS